MFLETCFQRFQDSQALGARYQVPAATGTTEGANIKGQLIAPDFLTVISFVQYKLFPANVTQVNGQNGRRKTYFQEKLCYCTSAWMQLQGTLSGNEAGTYIGHVAMWPEPFLASLGSRSFHQLTSFMFPLFTILAYYRFLIEMLLYNLKVQYKCVIYF